MKVKTQLRMNADKHWTGRGRKPGGLLKVKTISRMNDGDPKMTRMRTAVGGKRC